jgi:hypothetical protein
LDALAITSKDINNGIAIPASAYGGTAEVVLALDTDDVHAAVMDNHHESRALWFAITHG